MNTLFLMFHGLEQANGISKKVFAQVRAVKACGVEAHLCHYEVEPDNHRCWMIDYQLLKHLGAATWAKFKKRLCFKDIFNYVIDNDVKLVYIRSYHNANPFTIHFVKRLKKRGVRVVMEIPTYPYDQEYINWNNKLSLYIDRCFRRTLARSLDAIVTFTNERYIFGQRTIRISNGIDFDTIRLRTPEPAIENEIHLLGVAEVHYWHGFDRLIAGMAEYYKTKPECKVYFHLVGNLSGQRERDEILPLIAKHGLEPYVILYGEQWGIKLDRLFDQAHFAIGSLGRHRSGIDSIRTLKNREYAARGIAFAYSETDTDFDQMPYVLKVKPDESPISIEEILGFIRKQSLPPVKIRESITQLSWKVQMAKVLDAIRNE